jgi:exosortase
MNEVSGRDKKKNILSMVTNTNTSIPSISTNNSTRIRLAVLALLIILAGLLLYRSALVELITSVLNREGSSHGLFIPFISGYFIWLKSDSLKRTELKYDPLGIPLLILSTALSFINIDGFQVQSIGFIIFVAGSVWALLGRRFLLEISFPLFFLITMIPLPDDFYIDFANLVRDITHAGSLWVISVLGITFYQEGYVVHLPNAVLKVNIGCSGVRYLISFFVFGMAYAYLSRKTILGKLAVIASTFPISILASICRLTAIYLATYYISPRMAEHGPHILISWMVFFGILILAVALDQLIQKRIEAKKREKL